MIQLKNDREIDMIRKSGKVLAECLLSLDEVISEGISTYDIDRIHREASRLSFLPGLVRISECDMHFRQ